jgi:hypothetical protein
LQGTGPGLAKSAIPVKNKRFFAEGNSALAGFASLKVLVSNYKMQLQNAIRHGPAG